MDYTCNCKVAGRYLQSMMTMVMPQPIYGAMYWLCIVKPHPMKYIKTTTAQNLLRIALGVFMIAAAIGHFTFQRAEFQAQVPNWIPISKDLVVLLSGIVEISLGLGMIFWTTQKIRIGVMLAIFYILIFPGNIAQYLNGTDAFGLNTDQARFIRLFFQPILIIAALWSTGTIAYFRRKAE